jgi:hypothetical protein
MHDGAAFDHKAAAQCEKPSREPIERGALQAWHKIVGGTATAWMLRTPYCGVYPLLVLWLTPTPAPALY